MAWLAGVTDLLVCLDGTATPIEVELWPELHMAGGQRLAEVLLHMREAMEELGEAPVKAALGGALTGAQNEGRLTAAVNADVPGEVYACEVNDANTCPACADIDERYLGSTDEMDRVRQHYPGGGFGGYVGCSGRERCRGTIRFVWPEDLDPVDPDEAPPLDVDEVERAIDDELAQADERAKVEDRAAEIEAALAATARPAKVPAKRVTKVADVDSEIAGRVADLRRLIAREDEVAADTGRRQMHGYGGLTELVLLDDGGRFISKRVKSHDDEHGEDTYAVADTDKEELANLVAHAVGVDAPALVRAGPTHVYMEFVKGPVGRAVKDDDQAAIMESDDGHLVGLLDVLVANTDRNGGNWIVRDGRPVAIDHGFAWNETVEPVTTSPFAAPMVDLGEPDRFGYHPAPVMRPTNDLSPADLALVRERILALRPDFDRLGRRDWWDRMEGRLAELERGARGSRDRIRR